MFVAFTLMMVQALLGGIDNLWHHEITERLPARRAAARELALHALREFLYAFMFLGLAWYRWTGYWALAIALVLVLEVVVTLADFVVEDRTRRLPAFERILHTVLAVNYGALLAALVPTLIAWAALPSGLQPTSHGLSGVFALLGCGLIAWSLRNTITVLRLLRPAEWVRNPIPAGSSLTPRTLLISGATGFIGGHLVRRRIMRGDKVIVWTRNPDVALDRFGPQVRIVTNLDSLDESTRIDAIVNLAGAPILGFPWTRARRRRLIESRVGATRALTSFVGRLTTPARVFVSASAIGFYGVNDDQVIDEQGRSSRIFQSQLCQDWEAAAEAVTELGVRLVRLRIGLVLGTDGGALPQLLRPMRLGLGAVLGTGDQWVSWIHIEDLVRLVEFAIDTPRATGVLNAVAPTPVTHWELQRALARQLRRPLWLRVPAAVLRSALGEMTELLVDGQRVIPRHAETLGFRFRYRRIQDALRDLLGVQSSDGLRADVYFNGDCPVCRAEMTHYAAICAASYPTLRFVDSMQPPNEFLRCGLRREHLERRVYLRDAGGQILSGIPALLHVWSRMPKYRWLSWALGLPVLRPIATALYDHVVAPSLASWANRQAIKQPRTRHGWF